MSPHQIETRAAALSLRCSAKVLYRDDVDEIRAGTDVLIEYTGEMASFEPRAWVALRAEVEAAMRAEGNELLEWISIDRELDGRPFMGLAWIPSERVDRGARPPEGA